MPIYEYDCGRCCASFENLVLSASETVRCPKCKSAKVTKRFSVFGVGASKGSAGSGASEGGSCPPQGCARPDCGAFAD